MVCYVLGKKYILPSLFRNKVFPFLRKPIFCFFLSLPSIDTFKKPLLNRYLLLVNFNFTFLSSFIVETDVFTLYFFIWKVNFTLKTKQHTQITEGIQLRVRKDTFFNITVQKIFLKQFFD